ncbi:hypothetical protein DIURU_000755 [Diutina rugosa]|uniref:Cyclin n=1 Tax=Diutina rugosa TaxID=5481 RepID=A0A642UX46_DIURU|nr:uncharacterized protein DIURU_000755 [Diutina rugosa]KAA8907071.1 hypothetical protein DIURU_000755 [Diutina rugosa]
MSSRPISNLTRNLQGQGYDEPGSQPGSLPSPSHIAQPSSVPTRSYLDHPQFEPQPVERLSHYHSMYNSVSSVPRPQPPPSFSIPIPIPTTTVSFDSASSLPVNLSEWRPASVSNSVTSAASRPPEVPQVPSVPSAPSAPSAPAPPQSRSVASAPDHYMNYAEFLENLSHDGEDHLNIVGFPVNDLILMLSCLLSKIIDANDKLHPNHFDNTIAVRQRLKEERRRKRRHSSEVHVQQVASNRLRDVDVRVEERPSDDEDDDDDYDGDHDDEMKNKYLANVLAFHGTNVPGISLQAYLARVLKYCPVTNEVFLSLLVYFDRIAKKANNFKRKDEDHQLFVMDSYNIHRLIISGITVSSKFFSDIFYKNLRYAKVGGLPLEELNYLELQFLLLLDFKLMISVEDLQNYADLLLRFWKREQLAHDLKE